MMAAQPYESTKTPPLNCALQTGALHLHRAAGKNSHVGALVIMKVPLKAAST